MSEEGFEKMNIQTRAAQEKDLLALPRILAHWVKDRQTGGPLPDEVASIMTAVAKSIKGEGDVKYQVAEANEKFLGIMGFRPLVEAMKQYALTENPAEIINAFVDPAQRGGKGIGRSLVNAVEAEAGKMGYTEILLNSGPRYQNTAWGFYTKMYGEPVAVMKDYYGPGGDAPVWRKNITPKSPRTGSIEGPTGSFS